MTTDELRATLQQSRAAWLRSGALSTLSHTFQLAILRRLLVSGKGSFWLRSGKTRTILHDQESLVLDVVLTTHVPNGSPDLVFVAQQIAAQPVRVHGRPGQLHHASLSDLLANKSMILLKQSVIRAAF